MSEPNAWFESNFGPYRVMAILRGFGVQRSLELAQVAWDRGLDCVEVPIQSSGDVEALAAVAEAGRVRGRFVGAGTVVTPERAQQAKDAGAAFTVSPGLDLEVVRASLDVGLPSLPGVATPSDVQTATRFGLQWLKAFPAAALGAEWFRAMKGPFPDVRFVATGGLTARNCASFLDAGARMVAVGSALTDPGVLPQLEKLASGPP